MTQHISTSRPASAPVEARRYLAVFFASCAALVGALALFNVLIDPLGLLRLVTVAGINNDRSRALESGHREIREIEILRRRPEILVLGSSRELYGIEPRELEARFGRRAHNASIAAASAEDLESLLVAAGRLAGVREVFIGLDYFSFDDRRTPVHPPTAELRAIALRNLKIAARAAISLPGLALSIDTIRSSRCRPEGEEFPADGHRDLELAATPCGAGRRTPPSPETVAGLTELFEFESRARAMAALDRILAECARREPNCRLFIGPMSGAYLTVLFHADWERFQAWKRDIAILSERHGVAVLDFSSAWTESAQPFAQTPDRFADSLHYGARIGAAIVAAAMSRDPASTLTAGNLAAIGARDEAMVRRFAAEAPEFVARLRAAMRIKSAGGA